MTQWILGNTFSIMWTLAIGVIVIFLVYDWWCHQYFKRLGIPVAPYYPVIGNAHQWLSKGNNNFGEECVRKYGKVVGIYKFRSPLLYVSDKNIVKRVLVTDFSKFPNHWDIPALGFPLDKSLTYMKGQQWKDVRAIMTASFTASKLKQMVGIFNGICDPLLENIANAHVHNKPIDAKKVFLGYALQNISAIFLGLDISCQTNLDHPFVRRIQGAFSPSLFTLIPILFPWLGPLFELMGANIIPKESVAFFKKVIHQSLEGGDMIRQCGRGNGLNKYTAIVEELYRHTDLPANLPIPEETGKPKRLTYEEFFAACVLQLTANNEATSTILTCTAYQLALSPEVQDKLIEEIDRNAPNPEDINYDTMSKMKYTEMVIYECFRLYPPRRVNRPRMLGDRDVWQVHSAEGTGGPHPGLFSAT